jgi:broad specificity phosphatase PhoE
MSHSGCIRTLVGAIQEETPPLFVPNVSVTIIEFLLVQSDDETGLVCNISEIWQSAKVLKRCWCPHLEELEGRKES